MRSVSFSDGGLRDRDIIFRDETDLVFCFLGCVVKFPSREAKKLAEKGEFESWHCVSFFLFFLLSYRFSIFSRSDANTHTNKEGANTCRKAERRQRAVRFTRLVD